VGWWNIETATLTFRGTRFSETKIPTSSKVNINPTQQIGRHCLMHFVTMSKHDRGISTRGFSLHRLIASKSQDF
jgi:hypothetical protein